DLPVADRQRVVRAAGGDGREEQHLAVPVDGQRAGLPGDHYPYVVARGLPAPRLEARVRHLDLVARREACARIEPAEEVGSGMKSLAEHLQNRGVTEPLELRLVLHALRNRRQVWTVRVVGGDR